MKRPGHAIGLVALAATLAGCGLNSDSLVPLPGRHGVGAGAYTVYVELANAANLVANAEVRVADVPVGTVTSVEFENWHARLAVSLDPDVVLPANATATVAQKSLLGAEYLELDPPTDGPPNGRLHAGEVISLAHTGRYPQAEEVLAALSVVLNGGGLSQLKTITTELDAALGGREGDVRTLIATLGTTVSTLDSRRGDIVRALDALDRFSVRLNQRRDTLAHAIDTIPGGLAVLNDQRVQLVNALDAVSDLSTVATRVISSNKDDLIANLHNLRPALGRLADSGRDLTEGVSQAITFPFPSLTAFPQMLKGDYGNIFATLDINPDTLARNFGLVGSGGFPDVPLLDGLPPLGLGQDGGDPLTLPFTSTPITAARPPRLPGVGSVPLPGASHRSRERHPGSDGDVLGSIVGGG